MSEKCFLLRRNSGCGALNVKGCPGKSHGPFFKTLWEHEEDLEAANAKLRALTDGLQSEIAEWYYKAGCRGGKTKNDRERVFGAGAPDRHKDQ